MSTEDFNVPRSTPPSVQPAPEPCPPLAVPAAARCLFVPALPPLDLSLYDFHEDVNRPSQSSSNVDFTSINSPTSHALSTAFKTSTLSAKASTFVPFTFYQFGIVQRLLNESLSSRTLSMGQLRREARRPPLDENGEFLPKPPHALDVRGMVKPEMLTYGKNPLPPEQRTLKIEVFDKFHMMHCTECSSAGSIRPGCYYNCIKSCITNGFDPARVPDCDGLPSPQYFGTGRDGNFRSADLHSKCVEESIDKMLSCNAVQVCRPEDVDVINPLAVKVSQSRSRMATALTGVQIKDGPSFDLAKNGLEQLGISGLLKQRVVADLTASGVNGTCAYQQFSYAEVGDLIDHVTPNCFFVGCDVQSYYYNFQIAEEFRRLMGFRYKGQWRLFSTIAFGLSPGPYLTSCVTAELVAFIRAHGVKGVVAMIDDIMAACPTLEEAIEAQTIIEGIMTECGFTLNASKRINPCQRAVFKGILIDSVDMTICVSAPTAQLFHGSLQAYTSILEAGQDLSEDVTRHMCGVLEGWAQVCQQGKSCVASLWKYLRYGPDLWPVCRVQLLCDLEFWTNKAALWASGDPSGCYPIVNVHTLAKTPGAVEIVVTDWSGSDGMGGVHGPLSSTTPPEYFSLAEAPSDSSFGGELMAFLHVLRRLHLRSTQSSPSSLGGVTRLVVWISDNEGACHAVNSGRTHSDGEAEAVLHEIFYIAAILDVSLLASWIPRDANQTSDDLSHYAKSLGVREISGLFSELPACITGAGGAGDFRGGGAYPEEIQRPNSGISISNVRRVLPVAQTTNGLRSRSNVPHPVQGSEPGAYHLAERGAQQSSHPTRLAQSAVPLREGGDATGASVGSVPSRGPFHRPPGEPPSDRHCPPDHQNDGPQRPSAADQSHHDPHRRSRPSTRRRGDQSSSRVSFRVQEVDEVSGHPHPTDQDLHDGRRGVSGDSGQQQRHHSVQVVDTIVRDARPPQPPRPPPVLHDSEQQAVPSQALSVKGISQADQVKRSFDRPQPRSVQRPFRPRRGRNRLVRC